VVTTENGKQMEVTYHYDKDVLFKWVTSTNRPSWMTPVDVALISYLIVRGADDHEINDGIQTLAEATACDWRTVQRRLKKLASNGWLTSATNKGSTKSFTLTNKYREHLAVPILITPEAQSLANRFIVYQGKNARTLKFSKFELKRMNRKGYRGIQEVNAAKLIQKVGNEQEAATLVTKAIQDPRFVKEVKNSLYNVNRKLPKIQAAFSPQAVGQIGQQ